jgi:hypothetical protein
MNKHIFVFWTGDNEMSPNRKTSLLQLEKVSQYPVVLINKDNLSEFLVESDPLPLAYPYLSDTHKSDFLRAYFMHYHGGGYADIKQTTGSWSKAFQETEKENIILCGYPEFSYHQIAHIDYKKYWNILIGCGGFISKPKTPLTTEWYQSAKNLIEQKTELLKQFPATHPQECSEGNGHGGIQPHGVRSNYPIEWNEILGRIFQPLVFKYRNFVSRTVPQPVIYNYR